MTEIKENEHIVHMCLKRATGRDIHDVKNMICAYRMSIKVENLAGDTKIPVRSRHWEKIMIDYLTTGEIKYE